MVNAIGSHYLDELKSNYSDVMKLVKWVILFF